MGVIIPYNKSLANNRAMCIPTSRDNIVVVVVYVADDGAAVVVIAMQHFRTDFVDMFITDIVVVAARILGYCVIIIFASYSTYVSM